MKIPICRICRGAENLCENCRSKLKAGEIQKGDIDLARALSKLSERYPALDKAEFKKTISIQDLLLIVVPKGTAGHLIGRKGMFIKELSEHLNKKVKVVEENPNPKELITRVLFPARLLGVNVIYKEGREAYKVRVPEADKNKVIDIEALEKLFENLLGGETSIIFE